MFEVPISVIQRFMGNIYTGKTLSKNFYVIENLSHSESFCSNIIKNWK